MGGVDVMPAGDRRLSLPLACMGRSPPFQRLACCLAAKSSIALPSPSRSEPRDRPWRACFCMAGGVNGKDKVKGKDEDIFSSHRSFGLGEQRHRDVRAAIKREVSMGGETNFHWVPAEPPMSLRAQQWQATGDTIVDALQAKYPRLVVKRQEIGAHFTKELTVFRAFLTKRITS
jgi:hypothetical protein